MNKKLIICLIIILLLSILVRLPFKDMYKKDDAFTTYASVRDGTSELGITHPLWFYILSLVYRTFHIDLPSLGLYLSWIFSFLTTLFLYPFSKIFIKNENLALLPSFFHATNFVIGFWETTGLETSFFAFLCLFAFFSYFKGYKNLSYIISGLASITRPEGVFILLVLVLYQLRTEKRYLKSYILPIIVLFSLILFYGYIKIPNTIWVIAFFKGSMIYGVSIEKLFRFVYGFASFVSFMIRYLPLIIPFALVFIISKNKNLLKTRYEPLLLFSILLIGGYIFLTYNVAVRYFIPVIPFIFVMATKGFDILSQQKQTIQVALLLSILISLTFIWVQAKHEAKLEDYRIRENIETARWINENTPRDSKVAIYDIHGINTYFVKREIIDLMGLVRTREAFDEYWRKNIPITEYIKKVKPDYVIFNDIVSEKSYLEEFKNNFSNTSNLVYTDSIRMHGLSNNYGLYETHIYKLVW